METVYGDVLFLVNFAMDFVALGITGKMLRMRMKKRRIAGAAAMGGVYGVCAVFFEGQVWISVGIGIAAAALMCYVAFDRRAGEALAVLICVDFLLGGGMTAAWTLLGSLRGRTSDPAQTAARLTDGIPLGWLALMAGGSALAALIADRIRKKRKGCRTRRVEVRLDGQRRSEDALVDTGNLLRDPISGLPVMLLPEKEAPEWMPAPFLRVMRTSDPSALPGLPPETAKRIRIVPAHSLGGRSLLLAVRPDSIRVDGREYDALIALADLPAALLPADCAEF